MTEQIARRKLITTETAIHTSARTGKVTAYINTGHVSWYQRKQRKRLNKHVAGITAGLPEGAKIVIQRSK